MQKHEAEMWTRGMYCCMITGEAAGTAAALAIAVGVQPRQVDVRALQTKLAAQGVDLRSQVTAKPA